MKRRAFLEKIGRTGGAVAALRAMEGLGLATAPPPLPAAVPAGPRRAQKIVVIGAGPAGLATAWELTRAGYDCTVLEARMRTGGRVFTVRRGTTETDVDGHRQTCTFDEGQYYNAGAMRIPQHHTATLDYCRELGVAIEPFYNFNEGGWLYNTQGTGPLVGRRVRIRSARADLQGYMAELLAKALDAHALDGELGADDRDRLVEFLRREGSLGTTGAYTASQRRGYVERPGPGERPGRIDAPHALQDLLAANFGRPLGSDQPLPEQMFQIVGGTDRLTQALTDRLGARVQLGVSVSAVQQTPEGVRVSYTDARGTARRDLADFGVLAVPLTALRSMDVELCAEMRDAVASVPYTMAGKIGLQFSRRFWEEDDQIYGGISRTDQEIGQIVYPSTGFLSRKGVLIGYYHFGDAARRMAERTPAERERAALDQGAHLHPQYHDAFESSYSVAWHKSTHSLGGWAQYAPDVRKRYYARLLEPDGALYLAGDHLTYVSGWIAGALGSARLVARSIHERASRHATRNP